MILKLLLALFLTAAIGALDMLRIRSMKAAAQLRGMAVAFMAFPDRSLALGFRSSRSVMASIGS